MFFSLFAYIFDFDNKTMNEEEISDENDFFLIMDYGPIEKRFYCELEMIKLLGGPKIYGKIKLLNEVDYQWTPDQTFLRNH